MIKGFEAGSIRNIEDLVRALDLTLQALFHNVLTIEDRLSSSLTVGVEGADLDLDVLVVPSDWRKRELIEAILGLDVDPMEALAKLSRREPAPSRN
jgi:hypothetical protein